MIKLKGLLYRHGINGCGVKILGIKTPYHKLFNEPCCCHDACYDAGGSSNDRFIADKKFFQSMISKCNSSWHIIIASWYYISVRIIGWLFFNYRE